MNRIYKSIWSAVRRCFVVVSEVQKTLKKATKSKVIGGIAISVLASPTFASQDLVLEKFQDYSLGDLVGYDLIDGTGAGNVTINSINSPNGFLKFEAYLLKPLPEDPEADITSDYYQIPTLTIKGNTTAQSVYIGAAPAHFQGNVTVTGTVSDEDIQEVLEANGYPYEGPFEPGKTGVFHSANSYLTDNTTIDGDLTASVVSNSGASFKVNTPSNNRPYFAHLVVKGNLTADYVANDTLWGYDDNSDRIDVSGVMHVKKNIYNNGYLYANKLVVDGEFHNGWREYGSQDGTVVAPTERTGAVIGILDAKNIYNRSNLEVGSFVNTRDQVYNQSFGTIKATDNWFENSVINLSGGIIDEAYLGPDHNLGINNVFNVTGGTLKVSDLNFDSEVNLSANGKIETALESIFVNPEGDPEALNYVGLNAQAPETVKQSLTKWFTNYVAGTLRQDLEDHVNFEGGSIVISGVKMTETQYNDLMKAFKEALLISKQTRLNAYF